jgi:lambda repressor-like predicted transcriptional regulator
MDGPAPAGPAAFRWRLGVRPLDERDWIELGPDADVAIASKGPLMQHHADTVFAVLDEQVRAEATEVADALVAHLRGRWPDRYGDVSLDPSLHPLDAVARLVPEDLVLLVERGGQLVFGGGSVCFPNRWDLVSKIGLTMAGVHRPVDRLNEHLQAPIDSFFERLTPRRSFWRLGWGVLDTPDWYTPLDGTAAPRPASPAPA